MIKNNDKNFKQINEYRWTYDKLAKGQSDNERKVEKTTRLKKTFILFSITGLTIKRWDRRTDE